MIDLGLKLAWGLEMIYYRTHNKNKKDAQLQYKQKQAQNDRKALQENTGLPKIIKKVALVQCSVQPLQTTWPVIPFECMGSIPPFSKNSMVSCVVSCVLVEWLACVSLCSAA